MRWLHIGLSILFAGLCAAGIRGHRGDAWAWESDTATDLSRVILWNEVLAGDVGSPAAAGESAGGVPGVGVPPSGPPTSEPSSVGRIPQTPVPPASLAATTGPSLSPVREAGVSMVRSSISEMVSPHVPGLSLAERAYDAVSIIRDTNNIIHSQPNLPSNATLETSLSAVRWAVKNVELPVSIGTFVFNAPNIWLPSATLGKVLVDSYWNFTGNLMNASRQAVRTTWINTAIGADPAYGAQVLQRLQTPGTFDFSAPGVHVHYKGEYIGSSSIWTSGPSIYPLRGVDLGTYHFKSSISITTGLHVGP